MVTPLGHSTLPKRPNQTSPGSTGQMRGQTRRAMLLKTSSYNLPMLIGSYELERSGNKNTNGHHNTTFFSREGTSLSQRRRRQQRFFFPVSRNQDGAPFLPNNTDGSITGRPPKRPKLIIIIHPTLKSEDLATSYNARTHTAGAGFISLRSSFVGSASLMRWCAHRCPSLPRPKTNPLALRIRGCGSACLRGLIHTTVLP
mmetsp:Transcript_444/g.967  ORF Transcript_444/g.967 Transcript_444/m.967 type:complete len:200 (-) Transcript_444:192-791(-)